MPATVVFGATGRLGTALRRTSEGQVLPVSLHGCSGIVAADLTTADPGSVIPEGAAAVLNCAAVSTTTGCLKHPLEAFLLNSLWPRRLARFCGQKGIRLVHISTDLVWSGGIPPYKRFSPAVPMSFYGWTKLLGDMGAGRACPEALIVRTSVLTGEIGARNPTFTEDIIAGRAKRFYADSIRHHTPIVPLARILHRLAAGRERGLLIAASPIAMCRLGYAATLIPDPEPALAPRGVPLNLTMLPDIEVQPFS